MRASEAVRWSRTAILMLLSVVVASGGLAGTARAATLTACTAADISAQDAGCPSGTGPCTVTRVFDIGNGCTLDFGARDVTIASSGELTIGSGAVTILARNFTVGPGGYINGRADTGGFLHIGATSNVEVQRVGLYSGLIDVSGISAAGTIEIVAGGTVTLSGGRLGTDAVGNTGDGGFISIDAGVDIITLVDSLISANGGNLGFGEVDLTAGGRVSLGYPIDLRGSDGGKLTISAGSDVVADRVLASSLGAGGSGGFVDIAGTQVQLLDSIEVDGDGLRAGGAGCGGQISVDATSGDLAVANHLLARGGAPDGAGGCIAVNAIGSVTIQSGKVLSAGAGDEACGGEIDVSAGVDVASAGVLEVSAGNGAGSVDIDATGNVTLGGDVNASGIHSGSGGGTITVTAGHDGQGTLLISQTVDVTGGGCSNANGCGAGGCIELEGCDLTVTSTGQVLAWGPTGGDNLLTAHEQLTINGDVLATGTDPTLPDGTNTFKHPKRKPIMVSGTVIPAATDTALDTCTAPSNTTPPTCIDPCPICGNGMVQFPETCDNNVGAPVSCDGCSRFCRTENCDDGNVCTIDSCDPPLGCLNRTIMGCTTPTPTSTFTPTNTATRTKTATPTVTPTPTATRPPAIDIGKAVGRPAGTACVSSTLADGAARVAVSGNDIGFDSTLFTMSGCTINPAVGAGTAANKLLSISALSPGVERVNVAGNTNPIPDGLLYGCTFAIGSSVSPGTYPLTNTPAASDTAGSAIGVIGAAGQLVVTTCTGDCDGNGHVTIGEVIKCVNLFLGQPLCNPANASLSCPVADANLSGGVSIGEVTQCVSRFLMGC